MTDAQRRDLTKLAGEWEVRREEFTDSAHRWLIGCCITDLRRALLGEAPARSTGGSTLPGAMTPEFVHAREVAVSLQRIRAGEPIAAVEADYGFPGGMLAALEEAPSPAPTKEDDRGE